MMLLVVKTNEGYVRYKSSDDIQVVRLDKASVFPEAGRSVIKDMAINVNRKGFTGVRVARLDLTETDFFLKEEDLLS